MDQPCDTCGWPESEHPFEIAGREHTFKTAPLVWRCDARRSHGICNTTNAVDEETCGACGHDRPK